LGEWYSAETTEVREDFGVITNHSLLPIQRVFVNRPGDDKFVKMDIGPLVCSEGMFLILSPFDICIFDLYFSLYLISAN
jgi:hypothetical protein